MSILEINELTKIYGKGGIKSTVMVDYTSMMFE